MNATAAAATTAARAAAPVRRRFASLALAASMLALPAGVGAVAVAGAAAAAPASAAVASGHTSTDSVDALGGRHADGFGADGSYDPHQHLVWWAAGERFTEKHHDSCNPYTFVYGGVETDPHCPVGQVRSAWNVDFVKDAQQQAGFRTWTIDNHDLTTFQNEGVHFPFTQQGVVPLFDHVPSAGDAIFWTDESGQHGTVGIVLEAKSGAEVKVVVADVNDRIVTEWINPAATSVGGLPFTGYVTPTYTS